MTTYHVYIDWNNDGDFGEAGEDVTSSVMSARWRRGRDREWGTAITGSAEIILKDTAGTFNPITNDDVRPKRKLQITASTGNLFTGYIEEINPHISPTEKQTYISAVDGTDYLSRAHIQIGSEDPANDEGGVGLMLDAIDWPSSSRLIDTSSADDIPAVTFAGSVKSGLDKIAQAYFGFWFIDGSGTIRYETRQHRPTHATIGTLSELTATYSMNARSIYNRAQVKWYVEDHFGQTPVETINTTWDCGAMPLLPGVLTSVYVSTIIGPEGRYIATSPFVNTIVIHNPDETVYGGTYTAVTEEWPGTTLRKDITVTGSALTTHLHNVTMTTRYFDAQQGGMEDSQDATSIAEYQERVAPIDNDFVSQATAAQISPAMVAALKDTRGEILVYFNGTSANNRALQLAGEISDIVTVEYPLLGLSGDFYIDWMEHELTEAATLHKTTWRVVDSAVVAIVGMTFPLAFPLAF